MRGKATVLLAVLLTAFLCLGTVGYAGQIWWARRLVLKYPIPFPMSCWGGREKDEVAVLSSINLWRSTPWWGVWTCDNNDEVFAKRRTYVWVPRRFYLERLKSVSPEDVGDNPSAWEAWFKAHPNLIWDEKQKRLVEPKPVTSSP
jgi:hypothetical protein